MFLNLPVDLFLHQCFLIALQNIKGRLVLETRQGSHKQPEISGNTLISMDIRLSSFMRAENGRFSKQQE